MAAELLCCVFFGVLLPGVLAFGVEGVCVSLGFRVSGFGAWGFYPKP